MVLSHPEGVVPDTIHQLRHCLRFVEYARQGVVGKSTVIHCSAGIADTVHVDVSREQAVKLRDHARSSTRNRRSSAKAHLRRPPTRGNRNTAPGARLIRSIGRKTEKRGF